MVTWSETAKAYPLINICKATGMPSFVIPQVVKGYRQCAENTANTKNQAVEVEDIRECIAKGMHEKYPDQFESLEEAYNRLVELENEVGYVKLTK